MIICISFILFILVNYFGGLALELLLLSVMPESESIVIIYQIGCMLITCFVAFPVFLAVNRASVRTIKDLFDRSKDVRISFIWGCAFVLVVIVVCSLLAVSYLLPGIPISPPEIATAVWLVLITPVIEEIMYRGLIMQRLKKYGAIPAVLISTLLFSVGHMNAGNAVISFIPGIILAAVAMKTESIAYTVPLHVIVNLSGSVIMPIVLST